VYFSFPKIPYKRWSLHITLFSGYRCGFSGGEAARTWGSPLCLSSEVENERIYNS